MKNIFKARILEYDWRGLLEGPNPFYFEVRQKKKWGPFTWWSHYDTVYGADTAYELTKELNRKLEQ